MAEHLCKLQNITNLQEPLEEYHCGTCAKIFYSICHLHHHMNVHCDEGSYVFDNIFKTAFPRHVTTSSYTQTTTAVVNGMIQENNENIDTFDGLDYRITDVQNNCPDKQSESNDTKAAVNDKSNDVISKKMKKPADKFQDYFTSKYALSSVKKCVVRLRKIDCELRGCQDISVSYLEAARNRFCSAVTFKTNLKQSRPSLNDGNDKKEFNSENRQAKQTSVNAEYDNKKICNLRHTNNDQASQATGANVSNFYQKNPDASQEPSDVTYNFYNRHVDDDNDDIDYMDTDNDVSDQNAKETSRTSNSTCFNSNVSNSSEADTCSKEVILSTVAMNNENACDITTPNDKDIKQENKAFNDAYDVCSETIKPSKQLTGKETKKTTCRKKKSKHTQGKKLKLRKNENEKVKSVARDSEKAPKKKSSVSAVQHGNSKRKKKSSLPLRRLCDLCGLEFSQRQYKYHMVKHSGERPFLCNHCGQSFYAKKHLVRHLLQHQPVKPHTCSYCSTGFVQKCELRLHMNIHTGSRPFVCKMCDKSFNHSSNLRFHVKTVHLEEKNHHCPTCKRSFSRKSHLKIHILGHSEASFECSECMKKFVTPRNLKRHMEQHSSLMFKCVKCEKKLPVLGYLYAHMKRCHDISEKAGADLWKSGAIQTMPLENMTAEQRREFFQKLNKGTRPKNKTPSKKQKIDQISESLSTECSVEQVIPKKAEN